MGLKYLLDTNTIIYFLDDSLPESGMKWLKTILDHQLHALSFIARIELLSKEDTPAETQRQENFVSKSDVLGIDESLILRTIELRRQKQVKKLPDAIIAATALVHGLTLVTRNTADFKNVPGLTVVNPHEI